MKEASNTNKPERPWYWSLAPTHGNYCGPFTESKAAPLTPTDAACMDHDNCYNTAKSRDEELLCDDLACEALDVMEQENGAWNDSPGLYEGAYRRGMQEQFCGAGDKCIVEAEQQIAPWEQKPQRDRVRRILPNKQMINKAEKELVKSAVILEKAAEKLEKRKQPLPASVEPKVLRTEAKKARRQARRAARRAKKVVKPRRVIVKRAPSVKRRRGMAKTFSPNKKSLNKQGRGTHFQVVSHNSRNGSEHIRCSGREILGPLTIVDAGSNDPGHQLTTYDINPVKFLNTRLKQFAALFQRYRFNRIRVHFENSTNEFYAGRLLQYIDSDPTASYVGIDGTEQVLNIASAHDGENSPKVNVDGWCELRKGFAPQSSYLIYWNGDADSKALSVQGKYFAFVQDIVSVSSGSITYPLKIGRLFVEYDCEMWGTSLLSDNGYGMARSLNSDEFNGVQYWAWHVHGVSRTASYNDNLFNNIVNSVDNNTANRRSPPTNGILSSNEIYVDTNNNTLNGRGIGTYFRLWGTWSVNGTGAFSSPSAVPSWTIVANANCTVDEAELVANTTTTSFLNFNFSCRVIVTDPSLAWSVTTSGVKNATSNNVPATVSAQLDIRQISDFVPAPTKNGCAHAYRLDKGADLIDVMQNWCASSSCDSKKCPICPFAKIANMLGAVRSQSLLTHINDDSDAEEYHIVEKEKKREKKKEKVRD